MDENLSATRGVKEVFVVADRVKIAAPFNSEQVLIATIIKSKREVSSLGNHQLELLVTDNVRRDYFNRAKWKFGTVDLNNCEVWKHMGSRPWAEGNLAAVAELFRRNEDRDSRI
ncbi:MAG TPA: hypothetical protein VGM66_11130 [Candidatus Udaeobacter sp.]